MDLHPTKAIVAKEVSQTLELINFRIQPGTGHKSIFEIKTTIKKVEFSKCGKYMIVVNRKKPELEIQIIEWEKQIVLCKKELVISDAKKLIP